MTYMSLFSNNSLGVIYRHAIICYYIGALMQKRRNPIANVLVLLVCLICIYIKPSICGNYGFQMNILGYKSSEYHIQDQHL